MSSLRPLFSGSADPDSDLRSNEDQLNKIFKYFDIPNEETWPGVTRLPLWDKMTFRD